MFCGLGLQRLSQQWHIFSFDIPSWATLVSHEPSCCSLLLFLYLSFMPSCLLLLGCSRQAGIAREIYCVYFVYNLIRSLFMPLTWHLHKKSLIKRSHSTRINTRLNCTVTFRLKWSACTSSGSVHLCFMALETHGFVHGVFCSQAQDPLVTQGFYQLSQARGSQHMWDGAFLISSHFGTQQLQPSRCAGIKALNKELFLFGTSISFY